MHERKFNVLRVEPSTFIGNPAIFYKFEYFPPFSLFLTIFATFLYNFLPFQLEIFPREELRFLF